jgi:PAS domain S-box-containing protein
MWMECVGNILNDSEGQFAGAVLSSRDITKRKEIEAALRESEQLYRLLAENASDVIWTRDLNLKLTYVSPAIQKLRGYSVAEAMSQNLTDILAPGSAEKAIQFFSDIMSLAANAKQDELKDQHRTLELEMHRKDGSTVWTETQMTFLLDEQGKPAGTSPSQDIRSDR